MTQPSRLSLMQGSAQPSRLRRWVGHALLGLLACALLGSAHGTEPTTLTLDQAIELAVGNDPDLAAAQARLDAAVAAGQLVASGRRPQVQLEAGVQSTDNPVLVFSQKLLQQSFTEQDFVLDNLNSPARREDFATRIVARQPLYLGGQLRHQSRAAKYAEQGMRQMEEATRQQLVRSVTDLYSAAVLSARNVAVAEQSLSTAQSHYEFASSLLEGGLAVKSDPLLAKVRVSEVEAQLLAARSAQQIAHATLNLAVGAPAGRSLKLDYELLLPTPQQDDPPALQASIERALLQRPDLRALRNLHDASRENERVARAASRPHIGLEGSLESHDADFFGVDSTYGSVMLGLSVPLFDGGKRKATRRQAEAESRAGLAEIARLEDHIELAVRRAFLEIGVARQQIVLAKNSQEFSQRSLEIVEDRYRNGIATLVDLLDAQSAVSNSAVRVLDAQRAELLAQVALLLASGDL